MHTFERVSNWFAAAQIGVDNMELRSMAEALQSKFEPEPDGDMKTVGLYSLAGERSEARQIATCQGETAS